MRRRDFVIGAGTALAWPLAAQAQQSKPAVIGYLNGFSSDLRPQLLTAFRQALSESGYVEGRNLTIEYRWADGHVERLPSLVSDLTQKHVDAIVASGGDDSILAAKVATALIPIVGTVGGDPVKYGLVASLNRPGGNVTAVSLLALGVEAKRLEIMHEMVPAVTTMAFFDSVAYADSAPRQEIEAAAAKLGLHIEILNVGGLGDVDAAFEGIAARRCGALVVSQIPFFENAPIRDRINGLAAKNALPAIFSEASDVAAGSLLAYGTNAEAIYRQLGVYTARLLKGEKPADLPVVQPTRFDLGLNLKTAKALGLTVPQSLLVQADQVIE